MENLTKPESGFTKDEAEVADLIAEAYSKFTQLPVLHPSHIQDFVHHIHELQRILAIRIVKRDYPIYWKLNLMKNRKESE